MECPKDHYDDFRCREANIVLSQSQANQHDNAVTSDYIIDRIFQAVPEVCQPVDS